MVAGASAAAMSIPVKLSIDFESVTENKDGINVFEFFESTEIAENKIIFPSLNN